MPYRRGLLAKTLLTLIFVGGAVTASADSISLEAGYPASGTGIYTGLYEWDYSITATNPIGNGSTIEIFGVAGVPGGDALGFNGWSGGVSPSGDVTFTFNETSIDCSATCMDDIVLYSSYNSGAQIELYDQFHCRRPDSARPLGGCARTGINQFVVDGDNRFRLVGEKAPALILVSVADHSEAIRPSQITPEIEQFISSLGSPLT